MSGFGHRPANIAALIRIPLRGAKGDVGLVFNRVVGRGFVAWWLSRLGLTVDRARQSLTLESSIEIASHPSCSVIANGCTVRCRGGLHGVGCCRGDRYRCLQFGGRTYG